MSKPQGCECGHAQTPEGFKGHLDFVYAKQALADTVRVISEISQFEAFADFYRSWAPHEREAFDSLFGAVLPERPEPGCICGRGVRCPLHGGPAQPPTMALICYRRRGHDGGHDYDHSLPNESTSRLCGASPEPAREQNPGEEG